MKITEGSPSAPASIECLRARHIARLARQPGLVLIPVSPVFEWHSFHMPVGTDAIIVEEIARRLAGRLGAVHFRALPLGLDEWRDAGFKAAQGMDPGTKVFGMNYPTAPLESEYTTAPVFRALVEARLRACKGTGFRLAALVNHHGGCGQVPLLEELADAWTSPAFRTVILQTSRFSTFHPPAPAAGHFAVGGHAGLAETLQLMAFRPDLVDVTELPEGDLPAAAWGILHDQPLVPDDYHPRHATSELARRWGENVVANMAAHLIRLLRESAPAPAA